VASPSQGDRSKKAAVLKLVYLLAVTAVTFMLPALSATRPLRWFVVPALLVFQVITLLICRIPIREIVRPAWRLKWLFLFLIGGYTLLPPERPVGDLVLHWRVPGLEWLLPFNVTGLDNAAVMCLQILTVLLASALVRLTGKGDDLVQGLRALRLPALFVYSLDRTLSLLSGADERSRRRQPNAGAQPGAFTALKRLLRGDVGGFVQSIEANIEVAGAQPGREAERKFEAWLAHDVVIVSGIALCMASFKMLKFLPGLPFASGHKALLLFPLYVLAARLTHSRWGATAAGTIMGVIGFLQGDGRFGVLEALKHIAPGLVIDLAEPLVRRLLFSVVSNMKTDEARSVTKDKNWSIFGRPRWLRSSNKFKLARNDLTGIAQTKNPALAFTALTNVPPAVLGNSSFPKAMIQ
jgi:hypothetical protein